MKTILRFVFSQQQLHTNLQGPDFLKYRNEFFFFGGVGGEWKEGKSNLCEDAVLDNLIPKSQIPLHS